MSRLGAVLAITLLLGGCMTTPSPAQGRQSGQPSRPPGATIDPSESPTEPTETQTGPGTARIEIAGSSERCLSFGGCQYVAILRTDDVPQALNDEHDAELEGAISRETGAELHLGRGLPEEIEDGGYTLTFEERLISDVQGNTGGLWYHLGATCSTPFTVGQGRSVLVVHVAFPDPRSEPRVCSMELAIEPAP